MAIYYLLIVLLPRPEPERRQGGSRTASESARLENKAK
jgi:hypothetical protein